MIEPYFPMPWITDSFNKPLLSPYQGPDPVLRLGTQVVVWSHMDRHGPDPSSATHQPEAWPGHFAPSASFSSSVKWGEPHPPHGVRGTTNRDNRESLAPSRSSASASCLYVFTIMNGASGPLRAPTWRGAET